MRTGLEQESRDRVFCERCDQARHGILHVGGDSVACHWASPLSGALARSSRGLEPCIPDGTKMTPISSAAAAKYIEVWQRRPQPSIASRQVMRVSDVQFRGGVQLGVALC